MRKLRESKAMQDDLISCVCILGYGMFFIPDYLMTGRWKRIIVTVGAVIFAAALILRGWRLRRDKRMTPEEQREAKREKNDERSQMIQSKTIEYLSQLEDALLIIALLVSVFRSQPAIYCILYVILAVRALACVALRWWLERKY